MNTNGVHGSGGEPGTAEKILDAAKEEFVTRGYEGARIQRIAERSGANKAMIYYYYSSKRNLYREVVRHVMRTTIHSVGEIVREEIPFESKIRKLTEFYVGFYGSSHGFLRLLLREIAGEGEVIDTLRDEIQEVLGRNNFPKELGAQIERMHREGRVREVDYRQLFVSLISMCAGFFIFRPVATTILEIDQSEVEDFAGLRAENIADLVLYGIMSREEGGQGEKTIG